MMTDNFRLAPITGTACGAASIAKLSGIRGRGGDRLMARFVLSFALERRLYHAFYLVGRHVPGLPDGPFVTALGVARAAPGAILHIGQPFDQQPSLLTDDLRPAAPVQRQRRHAAGH